MRPSYSWVILIAGFWPLVALGVTFLRFGELPGDGDQIAAAVLGFLLVGGAFRARADLCAKANGESLDKHVRRRRLRPGRTFRLCLRYCGPALLGGVR